MFLQFNFAFIYLFFFQTAIYGQNFCTAAKNAFSLILRNIVR